jgi:hypothetical protein
MSDHAKTTSHNYQRKLTEMIAAGLVPADPLLIADIRHDDWCDALTGRGYCNCEAEIRFTPVDTPEKLFAPAPPSG